MTAPQPGWIPLVPLVAVSTTPDHRDGLLGECLHIFHPPCGKKTTVRLKRDLIESFLRTTFPPSSRKSKAFFSVIRPSCNPTLAHFGALFIHPADAQTCTRILLLSSAKTSASLKRAMPAVRYKMYKSRGQAIVDSSCATTHQLRYIQNPEAEGSMDVAFVWAAVSSYLRVSRLK